jgi:hypothetical protein
VFAPRALASAASRTLAATALQRLRKAPPPDVELAAAALDLPLPSTFEPSRHRQGLQAVELRILHLSPSPAQHWSTTAT